MFKHVYKLFQKPSALKLAKESLDDHERDLIKNQEAVAYYSKMAQYNLDRIISLQAFIRDAETKVSTAPEQAPVQRQRSRRAVPSAVPVS